MASLADYLEVYGKQLGEQASHALNPLHTPGKDPIIEPALLREPYEAQSHCITAGVRALNRQDGLQVAADCGTGKTLMAQAIVQGHSRGGYRAVVLCPPHLTVKWEREIKETVRNAHVHQVESFRDLLNVIPGAPAFGRGWWIMSSTVAKLGPGWRPAFITHRQKGKLGTAYCPKCDAPQVRTVKDKEEKIPITEFFKRGNIEPKKFYCCNCDEPLWQWLNKPNRWPVATYIHKRLRGWFDYCVIDESHECKEAENAIGSAMGSLVAASKKTICLTGTMCGGFAWHLKPLLFRIAPQSLIEDGMTWKDTTSFNEKYGIIEKRIVDSESNGFRQENKQSKGRTSRTTKDVKPGVMPTLFGKHLIQNCVFLALEDLAENLPSIEEMPLPVTMDAELEEAYSHIEERLVSTVRELLRKRNKSLLGTMMNTLLDYCDHPYGWKELGYYDYDMDSGTRRFIPVVTPPTLDKKIRPKEQALIDLCLAEKAAGRKVWVYSVMTDTHDVNERLRSVLAGVGLSVGVLRSKIPTKKREEWIAENGPKLDVCISHPKLVMTGLDFFDKLRRYNFPTLQFYSTGTSTFVVRQAARRAWRLMQWDACKVYYSCYADTMQERNLEHMARKQKASELVEGRFSTEGLVALAGDDGDTTMALARSLVDKIDGGRKWAKV